MRAKEFLQEASQYTARMSGYDANNPVHTQFANFWKMTLRKKAQLTLEEAWAIFQRQGEVCALTGKPFSFDRAGNWDMISADQINPSAGYTADNLQFVQYGVNLAKTDLPQNLFVSICKSIAQNLDLPSNSIKENIDNVKLLNLNPIVYQFGIDQYGATGPNTWAKVLPTGQTQPANQDVSAFLNQAYQRDFRGGVADPATTQAGFNKNNPLHRMFLKTWYGMKQRGAEMTMAHAWEIFKNQKGRCAYSKFEFQEGYKGWLLPSPDQVAPGRGYVQGNVRFVLWAINRGKQNIPFEKYIEICKQVAYYSNTP